jgi:hypothetical protein
MRHLALLCASIAAVLLVPADARATACQPPTVDWSKFPPASECVGGVIGFVNDAWGLPFPATGGHGSAQGCEALGACIEWVYQLPVNQAPEAGHWNAHPWGSVAAQAYDIAVFPPISGDAFGHIAMIDHVDGAMLWLMDDNWGGVHEKSCAWAGHSGWVHNTDWAPYGFFRLKNLEPCACTAGDTQTEACACGTRSRTCASCEWGDWGSCVAPDFAASVVDVSYPQSLNAGEHAVVWADFLNAGAKPWPQDGLWMDALGGPDGGASALFSPADAWPAWNVTAVLGTQVMPGDVGRFTFEVTAPATPGAVVAETFQLQVPGAGLVTCPAADITPSILILPAASGAGGSNGAGGAEPAASAGSAPGGCSQVPSGTGWAWGAEMTLALLMLARARRTGRRVAR